MDNLLITAVGSFETVLNIAADVDIIFRTVFNIRLIQRLFSTLNLFMAKSLHFQTNIVLKNDALPAP